VLGDGLTRISGSLQPEAGVGCSGPRTLACLRAKPADEITAALPLKRNVLLPPGVWWGPVVDGVELPRFL